MAKRLKRLVVPDDGLDTFVPSHIRYRAEELAEEVVVYPDRPESKEVLVKRCKDADGVVLYSRHLYIRSEADGGMP